LNEISGLAHKRASLKTRHSREAGIYLIDFMEPRMREDDEVLSY
jgi:hypothetical protein